MMTLDQVRRLALALPEATEEPHFHFTSFRVRGKIFATAPPDGETLHVFVPEDERRAALVAEPDFVQELIWGKKKVTGLRVILPAAKPRTVEQLLLQAWSQRAPRRLLAAMAATGSTPRIHG